MYLNTSLYTVLCVFEQYPVMLLPLWVYLDFLASYIYPHSPDLGNAMIVIPLLC